MFNKIIFSFLFLFAFAAVLIGQVKIQEGFESSDSLNLPSGWASFNEVTYPLYNLYSGWTVRDTGKWIPGVDTTGHYFSRAHSGTKSIMVSWWAGYDTNLIYHISDSWLVTKKITNIQTTDGLIFWACGGSPLWDDSLQIWVNTTDSIPTNFTTKIGTLNWTAGSTYGNFQQYQFSLSAFSGLSFIYIGFRYNMDCINSGNVVFIDDIYVGTVSGISHIGTGIPAAFDLKQNYPNPFNPITNIRFDIPISSNVKISVYNTLGQQIAIILNEMKTAGFYEVKYDASALSSGVYYYRIEAGNYLQTKKMVLIK